MSLARQEYCDDCEEAVNEQINEHLNLSYVYLSMAFHFDREEVALPGFHQYFLRLSDEERQRAEKLMKYQNIRGGRTHLRNIKKPESTEWGNGLDALTTALQLQKNLNHSLIKVHAVAENSDDVQFANFVQNEYLTSQVDSIKKMTDLIALLHCTGNSLGEYVFDSETLQELA